MKKKGTENRDSRTLFMSCPDIDSICHSRECLDISPDNLAVEISCWIYSSERQLARMRLEFLKSVLNQEVGAFDTDLTIFCSSVISSQASPLFLLVS